MANKTIDPNKIPTPQLPATLVNLPISVIERAAILQALNANQGNKRITAEKLGISLRCLQYRLADFRKAGWIAPGT